MPARTPTLAAIRRACPSDVAEGVIRLLFVREPGRIGLVQTARETAQDADQFLVRYLGEMITDVSARGVVVTVARANGRPTHADRQLWTRLVEHLAPTTTTVLDLVTLGPTYAWSARRARAISPPRRRRASRASQQSAGRRSASRARAR